MIPLSQLLKRQNREDQCSDHYDGNRHSSSPFGPHYPRGLHQVMDCQKKRAGTLDLPASKTRRKLFMN